MAQATFRIWRGDRNGGAFQDYTVDVGEGVFQKRDHLTV